MNKKNIKLSQETVRDFVSAASKCDFKVDLGYDRVNVDAKSIMGVFSLDLSHPLTVCYSGEDEAFECALNRYAVV